jgi:hypothetical protein
MADLLRQGVALRLQVLGAHLQALALGLQRLEGGHVERHAALARRSATSAGWLRRSWMSSMIKRSFSNGWLPLLPTRLRFRRQVSELPADSGSEKNSP